MKYHAIPIVILMMCGILLASGAGFAAPSFYGYTGLLVIPTADALEKGEFNVSVNTLDTDWGSSFRTYPMNYGINNGLEVGFVNLKPDSHHGETWLNAKYRFLQETEAHPAVAAGVMDLTGQDESTTYIVLSKSFKWRGSTPEGEINSPRFHIGIGGGMIDGVFGGISVGLGDHLLLMGEYLSGDFNLGARLSIGNEFKLQAGFLEGGDGSGIGLSFGKRM